MDSRRQNFPMSNHNGTDEKKGERCLWVEDKSMHETPKYYGPRLDVSWGHKLSWQDFICEDIVLNVHQIYLMHQSDGQNQRWFKGTVSWDQCGLKESFCFTLNTMVCTVSTAPCIVRSCKYPFHYSWREALFCRIKCCACCITLQEVQLKQKIFNSAETPQKCYKDLFNYIYL